MPQRSSGSQRTPVTEDERLLAQVPRERRAFVKTDSWRVLRIMGEFVEGFDTLSDVYNAVTVFGSARTPPDDPYYEKAVQTARMLAEEGFPIITGGGPGNATRVLSMLIYETGFSYMKMGRAAAISVVLFAIVMVLTVIQMKLFTRGEEDYA